MSSSINKALSSALDKIKKHNPSLIRNTLEAGTNKVITLDSPQLNYILGGGLAIGKIYSYFGPASHGKTTMVNYMCGQLQRKMPEGQQTIVYADFERGFNYKFATENGLDCTDISEGGKLIYLQPDTMEDFFSFLHEIVPTKSIAGVIFDSESAAPTRSTFTDEFAKSRFGIGAKTLGEGLRLMNILCANYGTTFFMISQERANVGNPMSHAISTTGGYSTPYFASWRSRVTKIQTIEDKGETIGQEIKVRNYKSKIGIPFRTAEMKLYFKGGFDTNNEYIDFLILFDIIQQRGAYFKSEEFGFSLQGRAKLQEWLDTHPEEYEKLKIKCNEEIAKEGKLDQNNIDPEIEENMIKEEIPEHILSEDNSKGEVDESDNQDE